MISKLKKIFLYYRALYKGELLKKIEYKIKDAFKFFYLRNKFDNKTKDCSLKNISINFNLNDIKQKVNLEKDSFKIFNKNILYKELKEKLKTEKRFWRNIKLNGYDDIKIVWEYNRLQYLLPIAYEYKKSKDLKLKNYIIEIIDEWKKNNLYEYSVNWNSNLEVAIRAINIILSLMIISDKDLNNKYSELLYFHAKHIYNEINYSDCCIPNNHVIGEATALVLLSKIIESKETKKWYKKSIKILYKYLNIIDEDGVSKENSFSYQWFVTKMYILSLCFISEEKLFKKMNLKINNSLNVLRYTFVNKDIFLNYGDNDDGYLYTLNNPYNIVEDIMQYYNFFAEKQKSNETEIYKNIFDKFNNKKTEKLIKKDNAFFFNKKIFIYNNGKNLLFFNAKNIEGHAHNDSLSINLVIDGKEIFLDSGTYSYNLDKKERSYYRSRNSHTTVQLEKQNAIEIGTFRWINNIESYIDDIEENDDYIKVSGLLKDVCKRKIKIYKNKSIIEIEDEMNEGNLKTNWVMPKNSKNKNNKINVENIDIEFNSIEKIKSNDVMISKEYLMKESVKKYLVESSNKLKTTIKW